MKVRHSASTGRQLVGVRHDAKVNILRIVTSPTKTGGKTHTPKKRKTHQASDGITTIDSLEKMDAYTLAAWVTVFPGSLRLPICL